MNVLAAVFCIGVYALLAQMVLTRELLVSFFGSELTIAVILCVWLLTTSLGAWVGRFVLRGHSEPRLRRGMVLGLLALAVLLPVQVVLLRSVRAWAGVPAGEYASLGKVLGVTCLVLLPSCGLLGLLFPVACRARGPHDRHAVSGVYFWEALGSMLGGAAFTYLLVRWLSPLQSALLASACVWLAACMLAPSAASRRALGALLVVLAAAVACPRCLAGVEQRLNEARWRAFGTLPARAAADESVPVRLVASVDSRYQNLAVVAAAGQFTLYGNGQILGAWPDPVRYEHAVHFIMAQKPGARRVLLLGGNPLGHIPELLKYRLERLDYVELDEGIGACLEQADGLHYRAAIGDPRVRVIHMDGPRYVRQCRARYDVILVLAPEPFTAAMNRYYTLSFYRQLRRILEPDGFVYTSVETSEGLIPETARLGAAVVRALQAVFDEVTMTGGTDTQLFAGSRASGLTFDPASLTARSRQANVATRYFRPEYFLNADEISPEKMAFVRQRLARVDVAPNTELAPVTYFYGLIRWTRLSASSLGERLLRLQRLPGWLPPASTAGVAALVLLLGLTLRARAAWRHIPADDSVRWLILLAVAAVGFTGLALEVVLIYLVQCLYGYVYARMGLIVALFMAGSVAGAWCGRRLEQGPAAQARRAMLACALAPVLLAALLPWAVRAAAAATAPLLDRLAEILMTLAAAPIGGCVGALFTGANRLMRDAGMTVGRAAASTDAADYLGSAAGSLLVGVVLLPVFGVPAACLFLAGTGVIAWAGLLSAGRLAPGAHRGTA